MAKHTLKILVTLLENCHILKEFTKQSKEKREISICNQESFSISQISLKKIRETTQLRGVSKTTLQSCC